MLNAENEFYANRRFAIHLIRPSHRRIGESTLKNHKCNTCMAKADGLGHQPQKTINVTPAWPRRTIGTSTSKNHKCDTCMAKADDRDFNLKETKKEYGKESTGLCELLHEAEI